MVDARLMKAIRDVWSNKARTLLAMLAIMIGLFSAGTVGVGYSILDHEINANYAATNPASASLYVTGVNDSLVQDISHFTGIKDAEARRTVTARVEVSPDEWRPILLFVIDDFNNSRISKVFPEQGAWPPKKGEILIERGALQLTGAAVGDNIRVMIPGGRETELKIIGTGHDPGQAPAWMEKRAYGYITADTLEQVGVPGSMDQIMITVSENPLDENHIRDVAYQLKDRLGSMGLNVTRIEIPKPGQHPHAGQMSSLLFLFEAFGVLAYILSLILVVNMISGMLSQQIRQIGIMKTLGATTGQIMGIYLVGVLAISLVASAIAIPASTLVGMAYAKFVAGMLNFNIFSYAIPAWVFLAMAFAGLAMPAIAALYPIYRGSRITIHQAINDNGINASAGINVSLIDRIVGSISFLNRPTKLSIRNTFRKKERLLLTLLTLAIGGALFIVAMNLNASMDTTVDNTINARQFSDIVIFTNNYPTTEIQNNLTTIDGITRVEGIESIKASITGVEGTDSNQYSVFAVPPNSTVINYPLIEGRWLQPSDKNAIVLNHMMVYELKEHGILKDVKVGDIITLNMNGQKSTWKVVGIAREMMAEARAYVSYDYYAGIAGQRGLANAAVISMASQEVVTGGFSMHGMTIGGSSKPVDNSGGAVPLIERKLHDAGMNVSNIASISEMRAGMKEHLGVIVAFVTFLAALTVVVGTLGLASTMSLNVLERSREIGVMRAIGATGRGISGIILTESLTIGLISWLISVALALPLSIIIGSAFGNIFFKSPLDIAFSYTGMILWLIIIMVLSPLVSVVSARNASKLPVHEVLAYE